MNSRCFKLYRAYSISFNSANNGKFFWSWILKYCIEVQAPVVQTSDSAINRINLYAADSVIDFRNTYPLDRDLSGGYRYPTFDQAGPGQEKENCCLVVTSSTKREIRTFQVVIVQRRQRSVQKRVMHVQSCCFANLRALSKSQNSLAGSWSDQTFWQWNRLFPRRFAEKPSPLCIIFRIWHIWMVSFN